MAGLLTIILAGGMGDRLQPLTQVRSKPSVPFAGKFRLIDFPLSNCINSGIRQIFVLTQYRSWSLQTHIQEGWGISSSRLGDFIYCVPAQQKVGAVWYQGTADAIRQNLDLITEGFEDILILSGDHVYKMNYQQMLLYHQTRRARLTASAIRVRKEQAAQRLGIFEVDQEMRAIGFEEKPAQPKPMPQAPDFALASMGIYIFKVDALMDIMKRPGDDFGKDILAELTREWPDIFVYDFAENNKIEDYVVEVESGKRKKLLVEKTRDSTYWRDVGSIDSYYEANMDLVRVDPLFNLYGEKWGFRTYQRSLSPSKYVIGGRALESIVSDGCIISGGLVQRSIISPGVIIERDALVEDSVVFDDVIIEPGAKVKYAIIDKESKIRAGILIGYNLEADRKRGCTITDNGIVVVPRNADIDE